ncbi:MAG: methyltransferase domain-containing protein [Thermogemmatispora sp.]|uniref:methyltransferase domain-containing protein n=1 Tax=Thermogemmatispora sp. TaxID=1968838 RepID=UPI0019E91641|nr:methyltransferase domain-containing protein [Thermogemmatispora sp.]MBE3565653.1 methyltransferase domain-containing protein [Thermogemmatispora sp.]
MAASDWNAALYDAKHAFVFAYGSSLVELLAPRPGELILDVGCGTGHLTATIARSGAQVVGLDRSPAMIEVARQHYPDLEWRLGDIRSFLYPRPFDAIFSNATLHWIPEAEVVVAALARLLKPGGRLVLEMGGRGNVAALCAAVQEVLQERLAVTPPNPWYFPALGEYAALLEAHGFEVQAAWLFERPTALEEGEQGLRLWLEMFGSALLEVVPADRKEEILTAIEAKARPALFREGRWELDYRRLRLLARRL